MTWDDIWEKVFQENEWGRYPDEGLIRFIARNFFQRTDRGNINILEVGCGPGPNIWYLSREGFDAYGIDGSTSAIEKAKGRLGEEGLKAYLRIGDIISLPYKDNFFDAVIDIECLYSNSREDTKTILGEIKRVLKKDGLFYSRTLTDEMYLGKTQTKVGHLEYKNISDGPIAGKGFARLMDKVEISNLYGSFFDIISVDKLEYTKNNGSMKINEWIIVCQNSRKNRK
ncbi:MAG: class I SAM-dependent methyltransferase [Candidatus Omnitrophota bacterium]|nr:MAG: class I SAM-dependent methyltransferase [Candidatus Omnitrophota bacterium]